MPSTRQLAAIMFTDMVGFTAMMQTDEQLAAKKKEKYKKVLENSINNFKGKILQYYGDGSVSIFNSTIDGVNCAIEAQNLSVNQKSMYALVFIQAILYWKRKEFTETV
jgi:class 3 adenylate cyclase